LEVAEINFVGSYTSANFHVGSGLVGVKITDPQVVNGGVVLDGVAHASPGNGLDLPDIGIGAHTPLAYSENNTAPGLGLTEGRYGAALTLLANYVAGGFAATAGGNGGALASSTPHTEHQSLFTHPRA
jgi:hypothetical protein